MGVCGSNGQKQSLSEKEVNGGVCAIYGQW